MHASFRLGGNIAAPLSAPADRSGYRILLDGARRVLIGEAAAELLRLSPSALTVRWPAAGGRVGASNGAPSPGEAFAIRLAVEGEGIGPLTARVGSSRRDPEGDLVDLFLDPLTVENGRRVLALLDQLLAAGVAREPEAGPSVRETIREPEAIAEVAALLAHNHVRGTLLDGGPPRRVVADGLQGPGALRWIVEGGPVEAPLTVRAEGRTSLFHLEFPRAGFEAGRLVTPLPDEVLRTRARNDRRAAPQTLLRVRFHHPLWPSLRADRSVRDVSMRGLSFWTGGDRDLLYPGLVLRDLEIAMFGEEPLRVDAEVRTLARAGERGAWCGVMLLPGPERWGRWGQWVGRHLHPSARRGSVWDDAAWQLYRESSFFALSGKRTTEFRALREPAEAVSRALDRAPHLGWRIVVPHGNEAVATVSCLKPYEGSWLGFQMAKKRELPAALDGKRVLRDLYAGAMEPLAADPEFRWLFGCIEAHVRWMDSAHVAFARTHESDGRACALPFRLMEGDARDAPRVDGEIACGPATGSERRLLVERIEATRPVAYREALDLVGPRLHLGRIGAAWRAAGRSREREILVARRRGLPIAAGVIEGAEAGTVLFRLVDGVRLFPLTELPAGERETAFARLLDEAARWHHARGKDRFIYFRETEDGPHVAGLRDLGDGVFWVIAASLLPEWLDHVWRLTTPRAPAG